MSQFPQTFLQILQNLEFTQGKSYEAWRLVRTKFDVGTKPNLACMWPHFSWAKSNLSDTAYALENFPSYPAVTTILN